MIVYELFAGVEGQRQEEGGGYQPAGNDQGNLAKGSHRVVRVQKRSRVMLYGPEISTLLLIRRSYLVLSESGPGEQSLHVSLSKTKFQLKTCRCRLLNPIPMTKPRCLPHLHPSSSSSILFLSFFQFRFNRKPIAFRLQYNIHMNEEHNNNSSSQNSIESRMSQKFKTDRCLSSSSQYILHSSFFIQISIHFYI